MSAVGNGLRAAGRGVKRGAGATARGVTWPARGIGSASRRRPRGTVISLGVVVVLLGVLSGLIYQQQHEYDAVENSRQAALSTAKQQAATLLSYGFKSVEQELKKEKAALTGKFKEDYTKLVQDFVAPAAKKQQITTKAKVKAASVMSAKQEQVKVLLFINQSIESKASKQPQLAGSRVKMTLNKVDGDWLVSELAPV